MNFEFNFQKAVESQSRKPWRICRFRESFKWVQQVARDGSKVIELGGETEFTAALQTLDIDLFSDTDFDFRFPFPLESDSFDLVIAMEIVEHISDVPAKDIDKRGTFRADGVLNCLNEIGRVLKRNGLCFLTTPVCHSATPILQLLESSHSFQVREHFREYSVEELSLVIEKSDLEIVKLDILELYNHTRKSRRILIDEYGLHPNLPVLRGDTLFMLLRGKDELRLSVG